MSACRTVFGRCGHGFVNPMSLDRGILGWADSGQPVVSAAEPPPAPHAGPVSLSRC